MLLRIKNPSKRRASMRPSFWGMTYLGEWMNVSVVRGGALLLPYSSFLALMQEKKQKKIKASGMPAKFSSFQVGAGRIFSRYPDKLAGVPDALIFFCFFSFIKERKGDEEQTVT